MHRIEPKQAIRRFYTRMIGRDLFGTVRLVLHWGWIGTNGQELGEVFADEIEAGKALEGIARAKRQRGYQDLSFRLRQASETRTICAPIEIPQKTISHRKGPKANLDAVWVKWTTARNDLVRWDSTVLPAPHLCLAFKEYRGWLYGGA